MSDFILEIAENERHVSVERGFVAITHKGESLGKVGIDSLAAVILSADACTLTKAFLARMGEENIPVVICGKNYMPLSIASPVSAHYRNLGVVQQQMEASPVLKKNLWQAIVKYKIYNQAAVLGACQPQHKQQAALSLLAERVRSGDADNKEAQAARLYWPALFGSSFLREPELEGTNVWLNYGYAVVRAAFARAICGAGLLPLLGLHHHNTYNAFCLADDLMEPVRPFVDKIVYDTSQTQSLGALTPKDKKILTQILHTPLPCDGETTLLMPLAVRVAQGIVRSFSSKSVCFPVLVSATKQ